MPMPYLVEFEIEGPTAMFARPDTGAAPISYPVPTWSACKAMCESVARGFFRDGNSPDAFFSPLQIQLLKPVRFEKYVFNYRGPLRKSAQMNKGSDGGSSYQLHATVLADVNYLVTAECVPTTQSKNVGVYAAHALQEMFQRRLRHGKSKYAPSLGWKEFLPTYFGEPRQSPLVRHPIDIDLSIPALLLSMWDTPTQGSYRPVFFEGLVKGGKLVFPSVSVVNQKLHFEGLPDPC
jgi:CRISPR-associated protein Cas5d